MVNSNCWFNIFIDYYSTFFCLLTHIGVTNIRATKIGYANALSMGTSNCKNKERGNFEQRTSSKKAVKLWLEQQQESLRDLLGVWTKLKESIFKNNNQINSTITTRTCVLSIK